jgi:hypothetical protein
MKSYYQIIPIHNNNENQSVSFSRGFIKRNNINNNDTEKLTTTTITIINNNNILSNSHEYRTNNNIIDKEWTDDTNGKIDDHDGFAACLLIMDYNHNLIE